VGYKLTEAALVTVCRILAAGGTMEMAADAVGCTRRALYAAAKREPEFKQCIKRSKSESKTDSLIALADGAKEDWRAAYKRLRMLYPEEYDRDPHTMPLKDAAKFSEGMLNLVQWVAGDNLEILERLELARNHSKQSLRNYKEAKQQGRKPDFEQLVNPDSIHRKNPDGPRS
jgi:hypothetical protein